LLLMGFVMRESQSESGSTGSGAGENGPIR
jgi:hypothetical protein